MTSFSAHFALTLACPRLVAGLLHLQHPNGASSEAAVAIWLESSSGNTLAAKPTCGPNCPSAPSARGAAVEVLRKKACTATLLPITLEAACVAGLTKKARLNRIQPWSLALIAAHQMQWADKTMLRTKLHKLYAQNAPVYPEQGSLFPECRRRGQAQAKGGVIAAGVQ